MNSKLKRAVTTGATIVLLTGGTGLLTACQPELGSSSGSAGAGATTTAAQSNGGATGGESVESAAFVGGTGVGGGIGGGVGGGTSSGALDLTKQGASRWADRNGPIDIATFAAVPGDVLTYTTDFTVTARGTGLKATLATEGITLSGNAALKNELTTTVSYLRDGNPLPANGAGALVTPELDGKTVTVVLTFTFPKASSDQSAQQQSIDLSNFNVTLKQV